MAGKTNNPFGYNEKQVGRTVQNITSEMWEPISTGSPAKRTEASSSGRKNPQRQTPEKKTAEKKSSSRPSGSQKGSRAPKTDVTSDRISEGGRPKTAKAPSGKTSSPQKKKKPVSPVKTGSKARAPKGKDTRTAHVKASATSQQKERQRAKSLNRSRIEYNEQLKSGVSQDDIRKKKTLRQRKKRRLIVVITSFTVLALVAGIIFAYAYTKGAIVSEITVEGESRYKSSKIIKTANLYKGLNMLSIREKTVNKAVTLELPYIDSVEVDYQLPDKVVLRVTPTQEKLLIVNDTGYICVNEKDKVLSVKKKKLTEGRYRVEGLEPEKAETGESFVPSEGNEERYNKAKEIAAAAEGIEEMSAGVIDVADTADIRFTYDSRIRIYLGKAEKPYEQLSFAMDIIKADEDLSSGQAGYVDMRFEDRGIGKAGSMELG